MRTSRRSPRSCSAWARSDDEVEQVLRDLRQAGCDRITIGQYLRPSKDSLDVVEYVPPEKFAWWKDRARRSVFLGPIRALRTQLLLRRAGKRPITPARTAI